MQALKITISTKNRDKGNYQTFFILPDNRVTKKILNSSRLLLNFCRENSAFVQAHGLKGQTALSYNSENDIDIICQNRVIAAIKLEKISNEIFENACD